MSQSPATFPSTGLSPRAGELFLEQRQKVYRRFDRLFAGLLVFEWLFGILAALIISPKTWIGATSQIHIHVWFAILLGGAICLVPALIAYLMPGQTTTRHIVALGQMLMSALLIHLTGGRIETHFHVFGSLAFLAFYRDWRVLITATVVVALDHFLRGLFWPQSVYGVLGGAEWRWLEHTGWVIFEDIFLIISCLQGAGDMRSGAVREAELESANRSLHLAYETTIEGWSRALDLRDNETEGHSQRVTDMALQLAARIGTADEELVHLRRGALLHDIGKMGVPDRILLKPGSLTDEEWVVMRRHPETAYELLLQIEFLHPALDIPYSHHEKWDGTGYPRGLQGEEIPLSARIFAIIDVWDALRSRRPYRDGWPERDVLAHIHDQAGKHFDPHLVEIFLEMMANSASEAPPREARARAAAA